MSDDSRWNAVLQALKREGIPARLQEDDVLGLLSIAVDLGDGWSASVTTQNGDLREYGAGDDSLQVALDGPDLPGEGYTVRWWPSTQDLRRLARDIAPLLRRLSALPLSPPMPGVPEALDTSNADATLRRLVGGAAPTTFESVWAGFCEFALLPVTGRDPAADEDLLLFECVVEPKRLTIDLVRQFTGPEDDAEMEQVRCSVTAGADPGATASIERSPIWGPAGAGASSWIGEVEATPAFEAALRQAVVGVTVKHSRV